MQRSYKNALILIAGGAGLYLLSRKTEGSIRANIVRLALKEKQLPLDSTKYWRAVMKTAPEQMYNQNWCGAFHLWALKAAGLAKNVYWGFGDTPGFYYLLKTTSQPKPGDGAYFDKMQHQAIVKSVNHDGTVTLINGNGTGGKISISTTPKSNVRAFYSIQKFIDEVL